MGRKPAKKNPPPKQNPTKPTKDESDDEIPEGYSILSQEELDRALKSTEKAQPTKKRTRTLFDDKPWKKVDQHLLPFSDQPGLLALETLDGEYFDQMFVLPPQKKRKLDPASSDLKDKDGDLDQTAEEPPKKKTEKGKQEQERRQQQKHQEKSCCCSRGRSATI